MKTASYDIFISGHKIVNDDEEYLNIPVALTTEDVCLWSIIDISKLMQCQLSANHYPGAITVPVEKNGKTVALAMAPLSELLREDESLLAPCIRNSLFRFEVAVYKMYERGQYQKVDTADLKTIYAGTYPLAVPFVPPVQAYPYRPNTIRATRDRFGTVWFCAYDIDYANGMSGTSASYVCRTMLDPEETKVMVIPGIESGCVAAWCVTSEAAIEMVSRTKFVKAATVKGALLWEDWFSSDSAEVAYESMSWAKQMEGVAVVKEKKKKCCKVKSRLDAEEDTETTPQSHLDAEEDTELKEQTAGEGNSVTLALLAAVSSMTLDTLKKTPTKQAIINALESALAELTDADCGGVFYDVEKAEADARAQFKEEEERKHKDTVEAIEDLVGQVSMLY